jgi:succinoglycan biosynthesis transport protein ExoP
MELRYYLATLAAAWRVVLACLLVGIAAGGIYSLLVPPTYAATTKVYVTISSATSVQDLVQGGQFVGQAVQSFADVADTPAVLDPVVRKLRLPDTAAGLAGKVKTTFATGSAVLTITAEDGNADRAARIANAVATSLNDVASTLTPSTGGPATAVELNQVQPATPPAAPSGPGLVFEAVLGGLVGLLVAVVVVVLRKSLDRRLRTAEDFEAMAYVPVLGEVDLVRSRRNRPLSLFPVDPQLAAAYRRLRARLARSQRGQSQVLLITSGRSGEGVTATVVGLGVAMARSGLNTLVVDANFNRPALAGLLGVANEQGLHQLLTSHATAVSLAQHTSENRLDVLVSGRLGPNAAELLGSRRAATLIGDLKALYDVVLIDVGPIEQQADAISLAPAADGVVLVLKSAAATRDELRRWLTVLEGASARLIGVLLTMVPSGGRSADLDPILEGGAAPRRRGDDSSGGAGPRRRGNDADPETGSIPRRPAADPDSDGAGDR